jgi:predicted Ser/Thr protein kinase
VIDDVNSKRSASGRHAPARESVSRPATDPGAPAAAEAEDTIVRPTAPATSFRRAALDEETVVYLRDEPEKPAAAPAVHESPKRNEKPKSGKAAVAKRQPGAARSRPSQFRTPGPALKSVIRQAAARADDKAGRAKADDAARPATQRDVGQAGEDDTVVQPNESRRWVVRPADKPARRLPIDWEYLPPDTAIKDRFVVMEMVGQGGMGQVYKALDRRREEIGVADPHVALKVLKPALASEPAAVAAFKREAATAKLLSSPRVVEVIDYDQDEDLHFIVSEYLRGESLHALIRRLDGKPMEFHRALVVVRDLAEALRYAHSKGVIHADFKPGNAFVCDDGHVKLLDFGVARTFGTTSALSRPRRPGEGALQGVTPAYASCEVLDGKRADPRDDIYSLAVVAYRLLSGRHPFNGSSALEAKAEGLRPSRIKRLKPAPWRTLRRALAFERAGRVQTMHDFIAGFSAGGAGANMRARLAGLFGR